jgi:IS5 family transposase
MKAPALDAKQGLLFRGDLLEHLNPKNPLLLLAGKIPWDFLEKELSGHYIDFGRPAKTYSTVGRRWAKPIRRLYAV